MSMSDSELIMSKRKRELKSVIIILRGVPGTGKTTVSHRLWDMFKDSYDYRVDIFNRDTLRQCYCSKHRIDYQSSFANSHVNTRVRDTYYEMLFTHFQFTRSHPSVTIIDSTNTKKADLKHLFWVINHALMEDKSKYDIYVYTKRTEYQSIHSVPEPIMRRFREELKISDEWLVNQAPQYNVKLVNKICLK